MGGGLGVPPKHTPHCYGPASPEPYPHSSSSSQIPQSAASNPHGLRPTTGPSHGPLELLPCTAGHHLHKPLPRPQNNRPLPHPLQTLLHYRLCPTHHSPGPPMHPGAAPLHRRPPPKVSWSFPKRSCPDPTLQAMAQAPPTRQPPPFRPLPHPQSPTLKPLPTTALPHPTPPGAPPLH